MIATTQQNMASDMNGVVYNGPPYHWKAIAIALMVILMIISVFILFVVLITPDESLLFQQTRLTLEDLEKEEFKVHDLYVTWLNDDEVAFRTREGHILKHSLSENLTISLLDGSILNLKDTTFQVSPDQRYILLAYNIHPMFSKSFSASYAIYSVGTGGFLELNPHKVKPSALQYAAWGPHGNQLIYMFQNNIYYQPGVYSSPVHLTFTGSGSVINGLSDWTYEEEILHAYPAYWWSGDGVRLAYLSINNTATPLVEIPHLTGGAYPSGAFYPYPKAGANIPAVSLYVVNVFSPAHTLRMTPPVSLKNRGHYLSMVKWVSGTRLAVRWLNRVQNHSILSVCEATTGLCSQKSKMPMNVWIGQPQETPLFSRDGSVLYVTLPAMQGGQEEYRHIAVLPAQPLSSPISPRFLTSGHWDVTSLCGLDEDAEKIFFVSTEESKYSRHLYSVNLWGSSQRHCLTCSIKETCSFYKPQFNPSLSRFILHCLGPGIPRVTVHSTREHFSYTVLEDNKPLSQALEGKRLPFTYYRNLTADHHDVHLKLALPHGYEEGLHPLLIIVDEAPGTHAVTDRFSLDWPQVLSNIHGVALAWVESRSGAARGLRSPSLDPRKLISQKVKDQLSTAEWLMELPYIDHRRIALYGKAFGGLLALKMMAATNKVFKCAAVMAPITDFKIYNAAFSERYLGLPANEESFYAVSKGFDLGVLFTVGFMRALPTFYTVSAASVLDDVLRLRDNTFLILHGTADAKVHFQHTAELIERLVVAKANYSLQVYPDEGHILRHSHSVQHLQLVLTQYLQDCMGPIPNRKPTEGQEDD